MNTKISLRNNHGANKCLIGVVVAAIVAGNSVINAEPKGGVAVEGAGGLVEPITTEGGTTTIKNLDGTIIEWESFQIQQGETTEFLQGSNSRVLNRVTGNLLSTEIHGLLKSDGRVFLVDPNGILVGQSGRIDTNGLVLSTLDISNDDFANNKLDFRGGGDGSVTNDGTVTSNSDALLIGGNVVNNNRISANGHVILAAGDDVFISGNLKDGVTVTTNGNGRVVNAGEIEGAIVGLIGRNVDNFQDDAATEIIISEDGDIVLVANGGVEDGGTTTDGQTGTETDGTNSDGTGTDGTGTDGTNTDGTETDGTDTDGTDGDETDGDGTDGNDGDSGTDGVATGDPVVPPTEDEDKPATGEEVTEETQVAAVNLVNSNESTVTEAEGATETTASEEDDESDENIEVAIASDIDGANTGDGNDSKPGLCR